MYTTAVMILVFIMAVCAVKGISKNSSCSAPGPTGMPILGKLLQLGRKLHLKLTSFRQKSATSTKLQWDRILPARLLLRYIANGKSMGFSDYGAKWNLHRKIAQNSLALCANRKYNPIEEAIVAEARLLALNLQKSDGAPFDPHKEIYLSVGNIICALCFRERYRRDDPDLQQLVQNNDEFMAFVRAGNPVDIMPLMRHFTKRSFRQFLRILETMDGLCLKKQLEHLATDDPARVRDITDALIMATEETPEVDKKATGLTDEHIMTTQQELIDAGLDTIASTLQWFILYMITNREWQENVHSEIHNLYSVDSIPKFHDMSE